MISGGAVQVAAPPPSFPRALMPLPTSIASDLAHVFQHAGERVEYGDQVAYGILREEDVIQSGSDGIPYQSRATVLRVPADALTGVQQDQAITHKGVAYRVRNPALELTGRVRAIIVAKVPT